MHKTIKTEIAVGIILILAIAVGGFVWFESKQQIQAPTQNKIAQPIVPEKSLVYTNDEFGFQITLPKEWENYKTETTLSSASQTNIAFELPTTDNNWIKNGKNYAEVFSVIITPSESPTTLPGAQKIVALATYTYSYLRADRITDYPTDFTPALFSQADEIIKNFKTIPLATGASNWQTYRNEKLGFEMQIPKKVDSGNVKVIENGNIVWVVADGSSYYADNIQKMQSAVSEFKKVDGVPWAILVRNVNNDKELDGFIKDRYGKECKLGEKNFDTASGLYDVQIDTGNARDGEGCFLNWILFIKYSPEKHLVAAWDQGQDVNFVSSKNTNADETSVVYDDDMTKSFRFIK